MLRLLLGEWKIFNRKICYLNCFKLVILNFTTKTAVNYEHFISDVERKLTPTHLKHINLKPEVHPETEAAYLKAESNCDKSVGDRMLIKEYRICMPITVEEVGIIYQKVLYSRA